MLRCKSGSCLLTCVNASIRKQCINNVLNSFIKTNKWQKYLLDLFHGEQGYRQAFQNWGLWQMAGVDNAEESSGLTDMGQTTQEAGWS